MCIPVIQYVRICFSQSDLSLIHILNFAPNLANLEKPAEKTTKTGKAEKVAEQLSLIHIDRNRHAITRDISHKSGFRCPTVEDDHSLANGRPTRAVSVSYTHLAMPILSA